MTIRKEEHIIKKEEQTAINRAEGERMQEKKQDRREYMTAWRDRNRDHIREYKRKWSREHPDKQREYNHRFREKHREKKRA